jgi:DNA-binding PadR family transcriptional regulator
MVKYLLLGILRYQPLSGYALKQFIDQSTANFWHVHLSQIYRTLEALEREGALLSSEDPQEGRPDRRLYTITAIGETIFLTWLNAPLLEVTPTKDVLLLKLFFSGPADPAGVLALLHLHRDLHARQLEHYRTQTRGEIALTAQEHPELQRDALFWEYTRRCGELVEEAYVRWLDETISHFASIERNHP